MSLRETLLERLEEYDLQELKIDRDAEERGAPVIEITALTGTKRVRLTFDKKNGMTAEHMADVMASYLRRSTRA